MATKGVDLNRSAVTLLQNNFDKLYCAIVNNDSKRQIYIENIAWGYSYNVAAIFTMGLGALHVIKNHVLLPESGTGYGSRTMNSDIVGEYLYFEVVNQLGANRVQFIPALDVEPGANLTIIVAPPVDSTGGTPTAAIGFLTAIGGTKYFQDEDRGYRYR
jgi:hypothetical protein